ncbi:uncharacterized [Tachysurus ichikawai]
MRLSGSAQRPDYVGQPEGLLSSDLELSPANAGQAHCLISSGNAYGWPGCLVPCPDRSARRAGSLAKRTTAGAEMAVVRFVITCTVVKMRILARAIHCKPFIALH